MRSRRCGTGSAPSAARGICSSPGSGSPNHTKDFEIDVVAVLEGADDAVEDLLADGWRAEDVALLSTGSRHPEQVERQALSPKAYWDTFWDAEQVFYGHVLGFKGLERRAVVLAVNSLPDEVRLRERIYVGLSRARDQLVVCGDPAVVREVGGSELARRLGV